MHPFSALYEKTGVSVVIIHHANKREGSADVVDQVSGSTGLSGAVENVLAMVRDRQHTILKVRPREEEESELALAFDQALMTWVLCGQAAQVARTDERQAILDVLKAAGEPMRTKEIAALIDEPYNSVAQLLYKMKHQGMIHQPKYGYYELIEPRESLADHLPGANRHGETGDEEPG